MQPNSFAAAGERYSTPQYDQPCDCDGFRFEQQTVTTRMYRSDLANEVALEDIYHQGLRLYFGGQNCYECCGALAPCASC
jgi:hypothetical protein